MGSSDWKRIPLLLAAMALMMVLVQPVSGVAWIWDLYCLRRSVRVVDWAFQGTLASRIAGLFPSFSPGLSAVATLALSLFLGVFVPLSGFDLQSFAT